LTAGVDEINSTILKEILEGVIEPLSIIYKESVKIAIILKE